MTQKVDAIAADLLARGRRGATVPAFLPAAGKVPGGAPTEKIPCACRAGGTSLITSMQIQPVASAAEQFPRGVLERFAPTAGFTKKINL